MVVERFKNDACVASCSLKAVSTCIVPQVSVDGSAVQETQKAPDPNSGVSDSKVSGVSDSKVRMAPDVKATSERFVHTIITNWILIQSFIQLI